MEKYRREISPRDIVEISRGNISSRERDIVEIFRQTDASLGVCTLPVPVPEKSRFENRPPRAYVTLCDVARYTLSGSFVAKRLLPTLPSTAYRTCGPPLAHQDMWDGPCQVRPAPQGLEVFCPALNPEEPSKAVMVIDYYSIEVRIFFIEVQ